MGYLPGEFLDELEEIKKTQGISRNTAAFEVLINDAKLGRQVKKKLQNKSKDILGFDI